MRNNTLPKGFTLIELMLIVAILSALAVIAIPKFGDMIIRSKEAVILGQLGVLRSAFSLYYADKEGILPSSLAPLVPQYLDAIPRIDIPRQVSFHKGNTVRSTNLSLLDATAAMGAVWHYDNQLGVIKVGCTHLTSRGRTWSDF